jgi:hypothetical protein
MVSPGWELHQATLPGGVIGNTEDFGSSIPGSSPGRVENTIYMSFTNDNLALAASRRQPARAQMFQGGWPQ